MVVAEHHDRAAVSLRSELASLLCGAEAPQEVAGSCFLADRGAAGAHGVGNHQRCLATFVGEVELGTVLRQELDDRIGLRMRGPVQGGVARVVDGVDLAA